MFWFLIDSVDMGGVRISYCTMPALVRHGMIIGSRPYVPRWLSIISYPLWVRGITVNNSIETWNHRRTHIFMKRCYLLQVFLISPSCPNHSNEIQSEYGKNCCKHNRVGSNVGEALESCVKVDWIRSNQETSTKIRQMCAATNCRVEGGLWGNLM